MGEELHTRLGVIFVLVDHQSDKLFSRSQANDSFSSPSQETTFSQVLFFFKVPLSKTTFSQAPVQNFKFYSVQLDPCRRSEAGIRVPGVSSRGEGGGGSMLIILNFNKLNKLYI